MKKRLVIASALTLVFLAFVPMGTEPALPSTFQTERDALIDRLAALQKELENATTQDTIVDPWPFVYRLERLGLTVHYLSKKHQEILLFIVTGKVTEQTLQIERALYDREYPWAYQELEAMRKILSAFGDPSVVFPTYQCLVQAYQDHPMKYPEAESDPALRWIVPPPLQICSGPKTLS